MGFTVAVLGAAGGIGQPLSLLLKNSPLVEKLNLFDVVPLVAGVAADLSHIETEAKVEGFVGSLKDPAEQKAQLLKALAGVDVAVIPAGVPRKPGMTRDDLFKINAGIVSGLIEGIAEACPKCMICIISNPVNSTVPIAAEVLKKKGVFDPKRLFGVSTLDIVRSNTFVAEALNVSPAEVNVPVVGGHSGVTILPLLSQLKSSLSEEQVEKLTKRIQNAGTEVVEAKAGAGSATLSMAFAGARFAVSVMKAMNGEENVQECAYVASAVVPDLPYFATPVTLGPEGAKTVHDVGSLSDFEKEQLETKVYPELKKAIEKGVAFVANQD
mmetsp:Transcript_5516/g.6407  ORF Transcript_5516/g.6407 Transcript_5516/m.6407 type:complete len:326 (+) Transcript_5516:43-1020(+)|eukprot:CAMPEP_0184020104 /NCGR_PEP_ID=MMETSP0954-20121128/9157_1 /TAXON_ID=627963 /ORGANISM="Aplanochytrium sp, Strain PBS07" /LENGTH=325 /DNA_ID=CAMNT_0026301915 /DNA_START=97 /DNA_END=1074 /DNA_ORIENTATION=+